MKITGTRSTITFDLENGFLIKAQEQQDAQQNAQQAGQTTAVNTESAQ
mgnify:CR=1 FL=1